MKTIRVLQLGTEDFSKSIQVPECGEWYYEPDFSELPEKDFDLVILDREVRENEFDYLIRFSKAYTLFITERVGLKKGNITQELFKRKMGKRLTDKEIEHLLKSELPCYFPEPYGEKFKPPNICAAQGFMGRVWWKGAEGIDLTGDFGNELTQSIFWRNNIPIERDQVIEFWLEYTKDDTVEIALEIWLIRFGYGTDPELKDVWTFSEKELEHVVCVENKGKNTGHMFVSVKAKGQGHLTIIGLHDRHSRKGKGTFIPGGERAVTSQREEVFYYFDPGNFKPPLNVYFSGYKTQEGFEGYYMLRKMKHPFLLISESRLEGGAFYIGSEEYENAVEQIIREHMEKLGFQNSDVILSGLSMGTFGALYYGCRIHPNTILLGKPLASLGDVAENERLNRPGVFPTSLDLLYKMYGSLGQDAASRLNDKLWNAFDHADWSNTRFAVAYMIEDDYDKNAYERLQSHLKGASGARIYGKGLHGRHNDNTSGIVNWFVNQYRGIIEDSFDNVRKKTGRQK